MKGQDPDQVGELVCVWGGVGAVSVLVWVLTFRCSLFLQLYQDIAHRSPRNPGGLGQPLWLLRYPRGKGQQREVLEV